MTAAAAMEPTSALDPVSTLVVEQLACELKETCSLVVVTHNMQQAARISDSVAFFLLGELIEHAPTAQLFKNPDRPARGGLFDGTFWLIPSSKGTFRIKMRSCRPQRGST